MRHKHWDSEIGDIDRVNELIKCMSCQSVRLIPLLFLTAMNVVSDLLFRKKEQCRKARCLERNRKFGDGYKNIFYLKTVKNATNLHQIILPSLKLEPRKIETSNMQYFKSMALSA